MTSKKLIDLIAEVAVRKILQQRESEQSATDAVILFKSMILAKMRQLAGKLTLLGCGRGGRGTIWRP